jgi:hypothetical protein
VCTGILVDFFWGFHDIFFPNLHIHSPQRSAYASILHDSDCSAVYALTRSHLAYAASGDLPSLLFVMSSLSSLRSSIHHDVSFMPCLPTRTKPSSITCLSFRPRSNLKLRLPSSDSPYHDSARICASVHGPQPQLVDRKHLTVVCRFKLSNTCRQARSREINLTPHSPPE